MQRQHSSQATSTLGNTPNLNIGFLHQKETTTRGSDEVEDEIDVGKSGPVHWQFRWTLNFIKCDSRTLWQVITIGFISLKRQVIFFSHHNKHFLFIRFFYSPSGFQLIIATHIRRNLNALYVRPTKTSKNLFPVSSKLSLHYLIKILREWSKNSSSLKQLK